MDSRKRRIVSDNEDKPADLYKEWDDTLCPICMEHPHNAILLVCSSHEKGCRSYLCDTSYRHSNCLDRFKKLKEKNPNNTLSSPDLNPGSFPVSVDTFPVSIAFPSEEINNNNNLEKLEDRLNLQCPLCRGTVSGLRVIEEARKYLNLKLRSCSRESCVFSGNYRELREHARRVHPTVRPADVDPSRERAWRLSENQREYNDIVSAVPGSVVVGDYAIERGGNGATRGEVGSSFNDDFFIRVILYNMMHRMNNLEPEPETEETVQPLRGRGYYARFHGRGSAGNVGNVGSGGRTIRRRQYLWGENLLGLQNHRDDDDDDDDDDDNDEDDDEDNDEDDDDNEEEDDEVDINMLSDIGPPRRRLRRRTTQARSENEDRQ